MKTKILVLTIAFLSLTLSSFTISKNQVVSGVYDGVEDTNYVFTITKGDKTERMEFNYLSEDVFENFDLDSDELIGTSFTITYEKEKEMIVNDDGEDEEVEYLTITKLSVNN